MNEYITTCHKFIHNGLQMLTGIPKLVMHV